MKKGLIITGGYINFEKINVNIKEYDIVVAADSGYLAAKKLGIVPDITVGDFDSSPVPDGSAKIMQVPAQKDDTDTMLACNIAAEQGATELLIIGGTGGRADHFLSNVLSLEAFYDKGILAALTDGENYIRIVCDSTVTIPQNNGYFSLFSISDSIVTVTGCKYPLERYNLTRKNPSFAVSNEVSGDLATLSVKGKVLLCESIK